LEGQAEGVRIRVITTEGRKEQGRYALDATKKLLTYYNRYFGIKYPLPKLDQIAIPGGFSGAMENWGGLTYNESLLLFDPRTSSLQTKQQNLSHGGARDVTSMVWRSGDDGLVGQSVAQRRVCHLDGNQGDGPFQRRLADVAEREFAKDFG